jgi:flagellin
MSMVVRNSNSAVMLRHELRKNTNKAADHLNNAAEGLKIKGAGDSAAEYSISERMRCKMHGLDQALSNAQTSNNVLKRAAGAVDDQLDLMKRVNDIAIQAADGSRNDNDRATLQKDLSQMLDQVNKIAQETSYNGYQLLDQKVEIAGSDGLAASCKPEYSLKLQTSGDASKSSSITFANTTLNMLFPASSQHWDIEPKESDYPKGMTDPEKRAEWKKETWPYPARTVDLDPSNCIRSEEAARTFLEDSGQAIKYLLHVRTNLGSQSSRLQQTQENLSSQSLMLKSADSQIRDADMASEYLNYTKSNVLASSSQTLLAQANQHTDSVVGLLA